MAITVETRTQVSQLYTALFGRAPDTGGLSFWTGLVGNGETLARVADMMYGTTPARAYYPSTLTNEQIIASFYRNVLGREADAGGLAFWKAALDTPGATPGSVIVRMIANVATYTGTDPLGLYSHALFNNKVAVAQHYAEAGGGVEGATAILGTITTDPATATAAIQAIDSAGVNAPIFNGASVTGSTLVMSYADASALDAANPPPISAFTVTVGSVARAVTFVAVDGAAKTVTLTLASGAANGQVVSVAYADPTSGNDANAIQDASGNDAASLAAINVTNNTAVNADVTPPVFSSASVTEATLVMTYTEDSALDAAHPPPASAFSVTVAGAARAVTAVAVDAAAKTVTLTLATAVAGGQAVTVAYADPTGANDTAAIQDAAGNDAATLTATAVANSALDATGPAFVGASVNGDTLKVFYDETVDPFHPPPASAYLVKVEGVTRAINAVDVDVTENAVILTLASAVANGEEVKVSYTDPTSADDTLAVQDSLGNDSPTRALTLVTNDTPDTTAPVFASATVNGSSLVLKYTELNELDSSHGPAAGAFVVKVAGVTRAVDTVNVDADAHTVTLKLASAVANGQAVTVAYTDPTGGDDANAIQDDSGNDAASFGATAVTNNTPDTTKPVFASASVNGSALVMTYTDPTGGNDVNAIQDAAGNDAASLAATVVTNTTAFGFDDVVIIGAAPDYGPDLF